MLLIKVVCHAPKNLKKNRLVKLTVNASFYYTMEQGKKKSGVTPLDFPNTCLLSNV